MTRVWEGKAARKAYLRKHDGEMHIPFSVEALARDVMLRESVKKYLYSVGDSGNWPRRRKQRKFSRGADWRLYANSPVRATIEITAYLTNQVPSRLRERTFTIRTEGEALCCAADMYLKVYEENAKLGGESVDADVNLRVRRRRAAMRKLGKKGPVMVNRGFEPYIWGPDIGDLVFERIHIKWTGPRACSIRFSIGS